MEQYIDKAAIMTEINKRIIDAPINNIGHQRVWAYNDVKDILNTLEVKEVNLDTEKDDYWNKLCNSEFSELLERDTKWFDDIANYFFELGLKSK